LLDQHVAILAGEIRASLTGPALLLIRGLDASGPKQPCVRQPFFHDGPS
jgi:hypothetical protein